MSIQSAHKAVLARIKSSSEAVETAYGVAWNEDAGTYARTEDTLGETLSVSLSDELLPIHANMKRCLLSDAGVVQYYLESDDSYNRDGVAPSVTGTDDTGTADKLSDSGVFTDSEATYVGYYVHNTTDDTYAMITAKDSDDVLSIDADIMDAAEAFEICTANLGGTDGQIMVQIPKFYYKYGYSGTTHTWEIATYAKDGYSVHPAFIKNGVTVDFRYMGAYEGIAYDDGTSAYVDGVSFSGDTGNDILSSVSGFAPWTDETRAEFRSYGANRGTGWRQQDYDLSSAIQLLYLIEYADWNSQSMIGMGRTELSDGTWVKDSYIGVTGKSNGDGNGTNSVSIGTDQGFLTDYMTYRGIENFFGNVWKFVDGININDNVPYVSNTDTDFADDTVTDYTDLGITLPNVNGYQKLLEQQSRGFLPSSIDGTGVGSSTYVTDYYYQSTDWRVARLGGFASSGACAGVACWALSSSSSLDLVYIGARLTY